MTYPIKPMRQPKANAPSSKFCKTRIDLARYLCCARSTLRRWQTDPTFPPQTPKGWDIEAARAWMEEHADENIPALAEEKLRLIRAQADLAEQKLQRETEILISKDAVKERLGNIP